MSLLLAMRDTTGIHLMTDSIIVNPGTGSYDLAENHKMYTIGDFVIASCGDAKVNGIIRYAFTPPEHPENMSDMTYFYTLFIPELKKFAEEHELIGGKCGGDGCGKETYIPNNFIIVYHEKIYTMSGDFFISEEFDDGFFVCGAGEEYACGYIDSLLSRGIGIDKKVLCELTFNAVTKKNCYVKAPFTYKFVEFEKK